MAEAVPESVGAEQCGSTVTAGCDQGHASGGKGSAGSADGIRRRVMSLIASAPNAGLP